jgi:hypothetical protein
LLDFACQLFMAAYQVVQDLPVGILPIIVTLPLQVLRGNIFDFLPGRSCTGITTRKGLFSAYSIKTAERTAMPSIP